MALEGFERLEKDLFMIRDIIFSNKNIQKMIYYSDSDPLSKADPDSNKVSEHIFLSPVFDTTREPFNKHTFISITMNNTELSEEDVTHYAGVRINVFSKLELWNLDNERIRPLAIGTELIKILHDIKLSSSHKLFYLMADLVTVDETTAGYTFLFGLMDAGGDVDGELY